jgi:hypothetical protein
MTSSLPTSLTTRRIHREQFQKIVSTAQSMGHLRFAREIYLTWLATFPGDLPANLTYARLLLQEGQLAQSQAILEHLCLTDPEYLEAFSTKLMVENRLLSASNNQTKKLPGTMPGRETIPIEDTLSHLYALGGEVKSSPAMAKSTLSSPQDHLAGWSIQIRQARQVLDHDNAPGQEHPTSLSEAEGALHNAIGGGITDPLVAVTHLRLLNARNVPPQGLCKLIEFYQQSWPECLQFSLLLANALMESGESDRAVQLLHKAATQDVTGQVIKRLWGDHHPYLALWPEKLEIDLDMAIPAAVAAAMGWNQLPGQATYRSQNASAWKTRGQVYTQHGYPHTSATASPTMYAIPEGLRSVKEELERVAERLHKPALAGADGRYPVYVVLTTRRGLEAQYGAQVANEIDREMRRFVTAFNSRRDWRALLFYADQESYPGVPAARHKDPWSIKLSLADLDAFLGRKGEMVGAALIVGGPEVVPFHHLPNPVDDTDDDVPSDNPYGTRDENYFIPEWPVGRLPGGCSPDATTLLHALSTLTSRYSARSPKSRMLAGIRGWFARLWEQMSLARGKKRTSIGYTAAIWRKSSSIVFRPIGEPRALKVSPPLTVNSQAPSPLPAARLGYFNLHGVVDAVEWFGQSDPFEHGKNGNEGAGAETWSQGYVPDYPVAIRPQDILNSGRAPEVVFSEACYGGHITGKKVEQALALKFIQSGSQAVVGSTCTSYGSITSPLIAADFLGQTFWSFLRQGCPTGEALRRAKISLAREMHQRQGYLDGEDQKTLISFVLYGDPLASPAGIERQAKSVLRSLKPPARVKTVCDRQRDEDTSQPVPAEVIAYAKQVVQKYLPGMEEAQIFISQEHSECHTGSHQCPTAQLGVRSKAPNPESAQPRRRVVVLSKQVANHRTIHRHYARITLDERNQMVKLVVSR